MASPSPVLATIPTPPAILKKCVAIATKKGKSPWYRTALLATQAGALLSLGVLMAIKVGGGMTTADDGVKRLLFAAPISLGLAMVLMTGSELLTGNMGLMPYLILDAWADGPRAVAKATGTVARVLALSFVFNLVGCILVAVMLTWIPEVVQSLYPIYDGMHSPLFETADLAKAAYPDIGSPQTLKVIAVTKGKTSLPFLILLLRGIGANWLVNMAIYLQLYATDMFSKLAMTMFPILIFLTSDFEHLIVNFYILPLGFLVGAGELDGVASVGGMFVNWTAVTIGNTLGALLITIPMWLKDSGMYHKMVEEAAAAADETAEKEDDKSHLNGDDGIEMGARTLNS